jgi:polysaccharide export outer membrane protein
MKASIRIITLFLVVLLISGSCVSRKKMTYLQYAGEPDDARAQLETRTFVTPADYRIMPFDNLYIRVVTPDPQWSEIFNPTTGSAGGSMTQESAALSGYPVDAEGKIEIPFIGNVEVGGKTLTELKFLLDSIFKNYLNDAAITVRLVNNYVSIIGEVRNPGRYPLTKDRVNIFEAISMAGDLNEFSNRQYIKLIRQSQYGPVVKEFSVLDMNILTSEYFYVMPNDIIYAQPMKGRLFETNSSVFEVLLGSLVTILTSVTTILVIMNYNNTSN